MPPTRISHSSQSFIASDRSSGLHPVSSQSCRMLVQAGRPAFVWPYEDHMDHRRTSLMSSSLLLQQCPACLVHLTLIVFMMRGRWPYSWGVYASRTCSKWLAAFLGSCHQAFSPFVRM